MTAKIQSRVYRFAVYVRDAVLGLILVRDVVVVLVFLPRTGDRHIRCGHRELTVLDRRPPKKMSFSL